MKTYKRILVFSDLVYCKEDYILQLSLLPNVWIKGKWYKRSKIKDHIATKDGIHACTDWIFDTENPHMKINVKKIRKTMNKHFFTNTQLRREKLKAIYK